MTKLLLLYGNTATQKTLLCQMLSRVLYIYSPSFSGFPYFSGAHDYNDLWVFDDFYLEEDPREDTKTNPNLMAVKQVALLQIL